MTGPLACVVYVDLRAPSLPDVLSRHSRFSLTREVPVLPIRTDG